MTKQNFLERLKTDRPILADGAMGTLLNQRDLVSGLTCIEELNITEPAIIQAVHAEYILAGAELIETNTYQANRIQLQKHGCDHLVYEINFQAVMNARNAVDETGKEGVYIAGAIGPLGMALKPYGELPREDAKAIFKEQVSAIADAGVDVVLLETFTNHHELLLAVEAVREVAPDLPIIAETKFSPDNVTHYGFTPARVANALYQAGVNVIGVNCGGGPAHISEILRSMVSAVPNMYFCAMPNAGFPELVDGRLMYSATSEYFADYTATLRLIGADIIGGCCGTTPDHIRAMRQALDKPIHNTSVQVVDADEEPEATEVAEPTMLAHRLKAGEFTITVEVTPPRSFGVSKVVNNARMLRDAGAHLLDIADYPAAKMKMSAWAIAHILQTKVGIETILHFPTRGRNLLRVQGDLLAAHALDLRNLFVTMGDPTRIGDYPDATDTFDIAPSRLIDLVKHNMNEGCDLANKSIGKPTSFTVGCALNMGADDLDREIRLLRKKIDAGSDFVLSQAVFKPERIEEFHQRFEQLQGEPFTLPVIAGIIPLYSVQHAQFLHNEVPGITIPDAVFKRLEDAGDSAAKEGVKIAQELFRQMRDKVQGAYIIAGHGRYDYAAEVINS